MSEEKSCGNKGVCIFSLIFSLLIFGLFSMLIATDQGFGIAVAGIILAGMNAIILLLAIVKKSESTPVIETAEVPQEIQQTVVPEQSPKQKPALMLLTLLQEKGRFVDFLMEDIDQYPNEKVGAAARVVHQGCKEVVRTAFDPAPVSELKEKSPITLEAHYASEEYTLSGAVSEQPPFSGKLLHRGWRAKQMKLPSHTSESTHTDSMVIVPAKVEV